MFKYAELSIYAKVLFIIYLQTVNFLWFPVIAFIALIYPTYSMRRDIEINRRIDEKLRIAIENGEVKIDEEAIAHSKMQFPFQFQKGMVDSVLQDMVRQRWRAETKAEVNADKPFVDDCWKGSIQTCLKISGYILAIELILLVLSLPFILVQ